MELYTLDGLLRRSELIEGYESYIWTERYSDMGELSIIAPSTAQFRNLLPSGTFIGLSESRRVMRVETGVDTTDASGIKRLTLTCKEITDVLRDRIAVTGFQGAGGFKFWAYTGTPREILNRLFDFVCRNGSSGFGDQLPLITPGSLYPPGNLAEDISNYLIEKQTGNLFEAIKELADVWDLGFRLYKGDDTGTLYFDVYKGSDRTTNQTVLPAVVFSESLDSLHNVSELTSVAKSKNVALVQNDFTTVTVFGSGASVDTAGFAKRLMYVDASDITFAKRTNIIPDATKTAINKAAELPQAHEAEKNALQRLIDRQRLAFNEHNVITNFTTASVTAARLTAGEKTAIDAEVTASLALNTAELNALIVLLTQRGEEELAKNRSISAFDGEITQLSPYKYNRDYAMGDLIEMRNSNGLTNQMLVTEQIFVSDESGERAYPTLTIKLFITPGSWLAWENTQVWQDAPGTWSTS